MEHDEPNVAESLVAPARDTRIETEVDVAIVPAAPAVPSDAAAIAALEEELGAIEAELRALDGAPADTPG